MIVRIKKYVAKVSIYNEHEDGTTTKIVSEITLEGKRFNDNIVLNRIPRGSILLEHGWKDVSYEIDREKLETFLMENGNPIIKMSV